MRDNRTGLILMALVIVGFLVSMISLSQSNMSIQAQEPTPTAIALGTIVKDGAGFDMVYIPAGVVKMGVDFETLYSFCVENSLNDNPDRCVEIFGTYTGALGESQIEVQGFWMDRYEITIEQYQTCVYYGDCDEVDMSWVPQLMDNPLKPQLGINWYDAMRMCNLRQARLPTEVEWEYAASGPDNLNFPWGNQFDVSYVSQSPAQDTTHEVGAIPENVSWAGVYDLAGNAAEWVEDRYLPRLTSMPDMDIPSETARTVKGGTWDGRIFIKPAFAREFEEPLVNSQFVGFRCIRSSHPSP